MNASTINYRNDISTNNNSNSNLSMLIRSKVNSTFCTLNKDDGEHNYNNKQKYEDVYNIYHPNHELNKNRTMSNIKPSRNNNNYFTLINNKPSNKNMNVSQQNTLININSYIQKNFGSNSLRKNSSGSNLKKNYTNTSSKKKDFKHINNSNNSSSLNITNNTYNMNKNNIMINVNPKNISSNMNIEKLKVQKKLYEYQRLIDQKLNELIKNRHYSKINKNTLHIRRNSSPSYNNSQRKNTVSSAGLEYYLKKNRKKSITPNTNSHLNKNNNGSKKQVVLSIREKRSNNPRNNSQSQSVKKNRNNVNNINNMKQNLSKVGYYSKIGEDYVEISKQDKEDNNNNLNGKINLSLRKFIFTKCGNSSSNTINKKY